jgi:hypothetical protein
VARLLAQFAFQDFFVEGTSAGTPTFGASFHLPVLSIVRSLFCSDSCCLLHIAQAALNSRNEGFPVGNPA